ncbi:MAG TPA: sulfite exporter TauE/SafE family protein [Terriglobales bacterium]|nr:sulfite exporter TauE/SafE family protein [Terriglobales bacterium]
MRRPETFRQFPPSGSSMSVLLQLLVGAVVGVLVGITGTGGAFIIPALIYLFRMDQLRAQGTALLISSLPIWFIAFIPYARSQHFDLRLALLIALGICVGSYFGASWAQHLPMPVLRRLLGTVLILVGARFLYQG